MSSARTPPSRFAQRNASQRNPASWYGRNGSATPGGLRQLLDAPVLEAGDETTPLDRGLGDVGEILEVGPEARLRAVDAQARLPFGERAGLLDELAQRREHGLVEHQVALVDEEEPLLPLRERPEQRHERHQPAVDREHHAEVEPVGLERLDGGDGDLRHGGGLAVVGTLARDVDAQGAVLGEALEPRHPLGRELGGVGAAQDDGLERHPAQLVVDPGEQVVVELGVVGGHGDGCLDRARAAVGVLPAPREAQHVARLESRVEHERGRRRGRRREAAVAARHRDRPGDGMEVRAEELGHVGRGHVHRARLRERGTLGGRERRRERGELDRARVEVEPVEAVDADLPHVADGRVGGRRSPSRPNDEPRREVEVAAGVERGVEHHRRPRPAPAPRA